MIDSQALTNAERELLGAVHELERSVGEGDALATRFFLRRVSDLRESWELALLASHVAEPPIVERP